MLPSMHLYDRYEKSLVSFVLFYFIIESLSIFFAHAKYQQDYQNILNLSGKPPAFSSNKTFKKIKKRSGTSFLVSFSA